MLPRINTTRTSTNQTDASSNITNNTILPLVNITNIDSSIVTRGLSNSPTILPSSSVISTSPLISSIIDTPFLISPVINETDETIEPLKHEDDIELERLLKPKKSEKLVKSKSSLSTPLTTTNRPIIRINKSSIKRALSTATLLSIQRKKRIDLTPIIVNNKRYTHRNTIISTCTETTTKDDVIPINKTVLEEENIQPAMSPSEYIDATEVYYFN
jgi:hypothetical protein